MMNPIFINGISKMAYRWFDNDEVAVAISFASIAGPVGCILGLMAGP